MNSFLMVVRVGRNDFHPDPERTKHYRLVVPTSLEFRKPTGPIKTNLKSQPLDC